MRCPDLRNPGTLREFNRVVTAFGGRAMSRGEVSPSYLKALEPAELRAFHLAHYYWNQGQSIEAVHAFVADVMKLEQALGRSVAQDEAPYNRPAPTWDDTFSKISERKVGGGAKSTPADQYTFRGILPWGDGKAKMVVLVSTVRNASPLATFLVNSGQRVHYGYSGSVPADAKFVDIEVQRADVTDDDLQRIADLAATTDSRPVLVRRKGEPVRTGKEGQRGEPLLKPYTEAELRAKEEQAKTGAVNVPLTGGEPPLLTTPPGVAPPRDVAENKVPNDQLKLFQPVAGYEHAIDDAAEQARGPQASEAQQVAGNYPKGHVTIGSPKNTMDASIETPAGESRRPEWPALRDHYGYFKGTVGFDKDHLDFFVVPGTPALWIMPGAPVFVVNQSKAAEGKGGFDEHKVILGAADIGEALQVYQRNYEPGWTRYSSVIPMTWEGFRHWAYDHSQRGPKGGALPLAVAQQFDQDAAANGPVSQASPGENRNQGAPAAQRDLFSAPEIPGTQGARNLEELTVELEQQRTVKLPKGRITTWQDAAHAFRELNRWPRERFQMIGVDKSGKPIAFYDLFAGALTQTSVYPREVWTALYMTPGVEGVWFAHNHPSGLAQASQADELLTRNLKEMLRPGMGVTYKGHIIIAGDQAYSLDDYARTSLKERPAPMEWRTVPVYERVITKQAAADRTALTSPAAARDYIRALKPKGAGLILMDAQHRALGWWPLDPKTLSRVGYTGSAAEMIRMVGTRNPAAAFLYTEQNMHDASIAARGLKDMLELAEVKLLDTFAQPEAGNNLVSLAERGLMQNGGDYTFAQLGDYDIPQRTTGSHPRAVEWELRNDPLRKALGARVQIVKRAADLPQHHIEKLVKIGGMRVVKGVVDAESGISYLVAENLQRGEAPTTLIHEAVGHVGIFNILPGEAGKGFRDAMLDIYRSRSGAIRSATFLRPYKFDYSNPTHQMTAAAEYVAHLAERGEEQSLWQKLVSALRQALRRAGIVKEWSENDIRRLLRLSRQSMMNAGEDTYNGGALWQLGKHGPVWYSALERQVEGLTMKRASGAQWLATIKARPGVKADELYWSGLEEWLKTQDGPIEREAILHYVRDNGVRVGESILGEMQSAGMPSVLRQLVQERDNIVVQLDADGFDVEYQQDGTFGYLHRRGTGGDMFFFPEDEPHLPNHDQLAAELNRWLTERNITARWSADELVAEADRGTPIPRSDGTSVPLTADELPYLHEFLESWEAANDIHDITTLRADIVTRARRIREIAPTTREYGVEPDQATATRYSTYTLPGGKNYRELLMTVPVSTKATGQFSDGSYVVPRSQFDSSHFDLPNIVAHVRMNERTDAEGKRVLFIEEIQSDWAERGRKQGFTRDPSKWTAVVYGPHPSGHGSMYLVHDENGAPVRPNIQGTSWFGANSQEEAVQKAARIGRIAPAPFVEKTPQWVALALKRVIRYAVDGGFDRVAWTTGDQQNARYSLEKHIKSLSLTDNSSGGIGLASLEGEFERGQLVMTPHSGQSTSIGIHNRGDLDALVGREVADRLLNAPARQARHAGLGVRLRELSGLDLRTGGEGMRGFYDKMVPSIANDLLKRFGGARVGTVTINMPRTKEGMEVPSVHPTHDVVQPGFDITPAMRDEAGAGLPMFQLRDTGKSEVYGVRDGRVLGYASRAYKQGVWRVQLASSQGFDSSARVLQAASIGEVERIFAREGLELSMEANSNIPVPDRSIFDQDWVAPEADTWLKRSIIYWQNRLLLPRLYEETIAREVGPIPEVAKAHREARLAHARAAGLIADFDHDYAEPIEELMKKNRLTLKNVGEYLYARHAPERNTAIEEINPENKSGSGMTTERAGEVMAALRASLGPRFAALEEIGAVADKINAAAEQVLIDKGLAPREAVELLRKKYEHYVPLREVGEDADIQGETGAGYRVNKQVRQAFGRFTEAQSEFILPALVAQAKGRIAAGENAEVLRAFLRLVEYAPNPEVWSIKREDYKPAIDPDTGMVVWTARRPKTSHSISVPVDGKRIIISLADDRIARAFNESGSALPDKLQWVGAITRFYASMATAVNPEFVLTNLMRDFQEAMIRVGGEQGPALAAKAAKDIPAAFWGAYSGLRSKGQYVAGESAKPGAEEWHGWYRRYIEAGGQIAYRGMQDPETAHKDFLARLASAGIYPEQATKIEGLQARMQRFRKLSGARFVTELVADINGAVENATRLAIFKNAIEFGMNDKDAAMVSRNATVDFNLKGEATGIYNSLFMFFNANVQGSAVLLRSVAGSPKVRAAALALLALGALFDWWNREWADKDEGGRSNYDNISEDMKSRNWIIMGPDKKNAIMIPLPFGFGIFFNIGRHITSMLPKDKGGAAEGPVAAAMNVFVATINAFSPFGNVPQSWLGSLQIVSPTFLDPAVQAASNRNWMDKPIYPERKFGQPQAASQVYYPGTPEQYVRASDWLNRASGGNEVRPGALDMHPNMLQHWVNSVFGSAGATYTRIASFVGAKAQGKEVETREIPFLRRFYYQPQDFELAHRFYDYLNKSEIAHFELEAAMRAGDADGAATMREEYKGEQEVYGAAVAAERQVAQISRKISEVRREKRYDAEQKKALIEKENTARRQIMQRFTSQFELRQTR